MKNLIFILVAIVSFNLLTSCQKDAMEDMDNYTETSSMTSEDTEFTTDGTTEEIIEMDKVLKATAKAEGSASSRSNNNRVYLGSWNVEKEQGKWVTLVHKKSIMDDPLKYKYEVVVQPDYGNPDLKIAGYEENAGIVRWIRTSQQSGEQVEVSQYRASDLKNAENKGLIKVYTRTRTAFTIELYRLNVDCQEAPTAEQSTIKIYDPVCGCDGQTYGNYDEATKKGITSWTQGPCQSGGDNGNQEDCCSDDPLNLPWMKEFLSNSSAETCGAVIKCCQLNGQPVIDVFVGPECNDATGYIFDCTGKEIARYGGWTGESAPTLTNCKEIFNGKPSDDNTGGDNEDCVLFDEHFSNKQHNTYIDQYEGWRKNNGVQGKAGIVLSTANSGKVLKLDNTDGIQKSALLTVSAPKQTTYDVNFDIYTSTAANSRIFLYDQNGKVLTSIKFETPTYKGKWVQVNVKIDQRNNRWITYIEGNPLASGSISANAQLKHVSFHTKNDGKKYKFWVDNCEVKQEDCH